MCKVLTIELEPDFLENYILFSLYGLNYFESFKKDYSMLFFEIEDNEGGVGGECMYDAP